MNLFEDVTVGHVAVVDLKYDRQQLEEIVVVLPFLAKIQIAVIEVHTVT